MPLSLRPQHVRRYKDIARLLVKYGHADLLPRAGLTDALDPSDRDAPREGLPADAKDLATDLEALGPTFVKLGQLLSTRADLLPAAYLDALSRLQDKCEPFPYDDVVAIIEAELGARVSKAFATFDPAPIAAASLGQVHRATMRDGRPVAVKVQRPGIEEQIITDLESIAEIAAFVDRHSETGRRFGFAAMAAEFRVAMLHELDYRREALNLTTLAENLAEFDSIVVPVPVPDFTSGRVLTMTYVPGRNISAVPATPGPRSTARRWRAICSTPTSSRSSSTGSSTPTRIPAT